MLVAIKRGLGKSYLLRFIILLFSLFLINENLFAKSEPEQISDNKAGIELLKEKNSHELNKDKNSGTGKNQQALAFADFINDINRVGELVTVENKKISKDTLRSLEKSILKNLKIIYDDPKLLREVEESFFKANLNPQKVLSGLKKVFNNASKKSNGNNESLNQTVKIIDKTERTSNSRVIAREIIKKVSVIGEKYNKLSEPIKNALGSEIPSHYLAGIEHSYKWYKGEESVTKALTSVAEEYCLYKTSNYVTDAIVQKIGNKTVVTALIGDAAGSALVKKGVATFVSDGSRNVYHFMKGDISREQFYKETAKSVGRSIAAGVGGAAAVWVANTVLGPHIVAVIPFGNKAFESLGSMAGIWVFDKVVSYFDKPEERAEIKTDEVPILKDMAYEKLDERNFFFIEDVLGNLPLEMQKGITAFNSEELILTPSAFDDNFMNRPTAFNTEEWKLNPSVYDDNFMNRPTAFNSEEWIIRNGQYENK